MRLLALVIAVSASLATPAAALAHGYAHGEAAEHAQHHESGSAHHTEHPAVTSDDHDADHEHPRLDASPLTRVVKDLPAAIHSSSVGLVIADVVHRASTGAPEPNESPPERPDSSAPQSRAPPAL